MLIKRKNISGILKTIKTVSDKKFDIKLQYKFIKIQKALDEELQIYQNQLFENCKEFFEKDENGQFNVSDGGYAINPDKIQECEQVIRRIDEMEIQIPDIYLSLDELESLDLTYTELMVFECFIKE